MKQVKALLTGAMMLWLCGCQSLTVLALKSFDPKPYAMPVSAMPLAVLLVDPPTTLADLSAPVEATTATPSATVETGLPLESALELEPERTDVQGRGVGLAVSDKVVVTGHKDIAHRVPDYSIEQVAAMVCDRRGQGDAGREKAARRAYAMTVAANDARIAYLAGKRSGKDLDEAERKRQDAVSAMTTSLFSGMFGARSKKKDLPKPDFEGVVLENVDLYTFNENGRPVMAVSGLVRNTTDKRVEPAPITLIALDAWEFILAGQTLLLPFDFLEPGEAKIFDLRFLNPPDTTYEVYVHFAPPFEYRLRRECDPLDVATDIVAAPRSAADAATAVAPIHTAAELSLLTGIYRSEAESAWNLRACATPRGDPADDPANPREAFEIGPRSGGERSSVSVSINLGKFNREGLCAAWSRRLPWRASFALGERADESWGALWAAENTKRRQAKGLATKAEADAAETAFRRSYAGLRALGAATLSRAGAGVEGVAVEITSSTFGYDQFSKAFDGADVSEVGFYVDVSGVIRNSTKTTRKVDALFLALVDRLEQPLLTFQLGDPMTLEGGEARAFQHRVYFTDPVRRKDSKDAPPWQVRVGAVAQ